MNRPAPGEHHLSCRRASPHPPLSAVELPSMAEDLASAMRRGELELHYQPQQDLASGELSGFEALLRWHRSGMLVAPWEFIPVAEASGLIVPIGAWVFEQACLRAAEWNGERQADFKRPLVIAVNVAMQQILHPDFVDMVRMGLSRSGAHAQWLEIELTESTAMQDPDKVRQVLQEIRALGVSVAMDDFGTGYSSLARLHRLPLDKLKLDRTFISGMCRGWSEGDAPIVRAVVDLAHAMHLTVLAEGVEMFEQRALLIALGCDEIQGYLFGRPLPLEQARSLVEGLRPNRRSAFDMLDLDAATAESELRAWFCAHPEIT